MRYLNKQHGHISKKLSLISFLILLASIPSLTGCKKFLDIDGPKNQFDSKLVFENDQTATSAITGIYSRMSTSQSGFASGAVGSVSSLAGLSADELSGFNSSLTVFSQNEIASSNSYISTLWASAYNHIYVANAVIEELPAAQGVSAGTKSQLLGEAKFVRAFCYFYLVNLFGEIPLIINTDYRNNQSTVKAGVNNVYEQVIADLTEAQNLMSGNYVNTERVRPNRWAAKALLARTCLYLGRWDDADRLCSEIIAQNSLYRLTNDLNQVFLKNSTETIWQIMPPAGNNTNEGGLFVLTGTPFYVALNPALRSSFDANDPRLAKWVNKLVNTTGDYSYPFKYKIRTQINVTLQVSEYSTVLRLAEIYLIRAEARIQNNEVSSGISDLNVIRRRAIDNSTSTNNISLLSLNLNKNDALSAVANERRSELFSEWGHRWLDLKRTGQASAVLEPLKGARWNVTDELYPIPQSEISRNLTIIQNTGY